MAHFAEIDSNNIVTQVLVVSDSQQHRGQDFLSKDLKLGGTWIQTSYNTFGNTHKTGGTPFRKNYAGIGYTYDLTRDAFIPPQPFNSWTLNENTCLWNAPVSKPDNKNSYIWEESTLSWKKINTTELPI